MSDSAIQPAPAAQPQRPKRRRPIASLIVLALVGVSLWLLSTYYYFFFHGPVPADDARLLADAAPARLSWLIDYVRIDDRELLPSGYEERNTRNGKVTSVHPYWLLPVGDKLLLVMTESRADTRHLVGPVSTISMKSTVEVRDKMLAEHPELKDRLLPIMLNAAAAYNVFGYIGLVFFPLVTLLCLFNIVRAWRKRPEA